MSLLTYHLFCSLTIFIATNSLVSAAIRGRYGVNEEDSPRLRAKKTFEPSEECLYRRRSDDTDHHKSFTEWMHFKNASHYLPILPAYPTILRQFDNGDFLNSKPLTGSRRNECSYNQESLVTETEPSHDRALCQYRYFLDYNAKRIPATLPYVQCLCDRFQIDKKYSFKCMEEYYDVRVLEFDDECTEYTTKWHRIAIGCAPVITAGARSQSGTTKTQIPLDVDQNKPTK